MAVTLETLQLLISVNHQELTAGLNKANRQVDNFAKKTNKSFKLLKIAAIGIFGSQFLRSTINAASSMQKLEFRLKTATGSAAGAAEAMSFLNDMAKRQSVDVLALADGYTRLLPSVKSGALTMGEMREILSLVNDNMKAFGASTEDAKFIFFGLSQLLGSGIVTMENLKQVTERLPGSLEALATATGKPLGELIKWISTGQVTAQMLKGDLLEAFKINEGAAEDLAGAYESSVTRMKNSFRLLSSELSKEGGLLDGLSALVDGVTIVSDAMAASADVIFEYIKLITDIMPGFRFAKIGLSLFNDEQAKFNKLTKEANDLLEFSIGLQKQIDLLLGKTTIKEKKTKVPVPVEKPGEIIGEAFRREQELLKELRAKADKEAEDKEAEHQQILKDLREGAAQGILNDTEIFLKRLKALERTKGEERARGTIFALRDILSETTKHNKLLFNVNKGLAIADAVVSTAQGVSRELSKGIIGLPTAAIIAAAGAAQIATITSTSFTGGGGGGGGGGAIASTGGNAGAVQDTAGGGGGDKGLNIAIQGVDRDALFSGSQIREIFSALNEQIEDGAILKGVSFV